MPRIKGSPRPPGSGRAKGTPNKTTAAVKDMLRAALEQAGGTEYLVRQADENPPAFMALVGKLIPSEIAAKIDANVTLQSLVEASIVKAAAQQKSDEQQGG